jgi:tRNA dimethylallyltransferase
VRDDVPAAYPLIAFALGLAVRLGIREALGFAAIALLLRSRGIPLLFLALGILLTPKPAAIDFDPDRFVTIEAPLERDWAVRRNAYLLRSPKFAVNGIEIDEPLAIYARFAPPAMQLESHVRAEGFLRRNERGAFVLTLKAEQLMSYRGELRGPARWNRILANRLRPHAARHPTEVALVEALVLGRGERLTEEVRASFKRGGTYHLLVFSGMQIAFAAALLAMLLRWLHAPRASDWLLLAFAAIAPLFIGPTASVSRASSGIALYALSRILRRPTSLENLWCVAALARLLLEPRDLTDPSFHLTYAGAGALLFVARKRHWLLRALSAELAITPLTLFHFHQYALGGSLVTVAMAPLIGSMLVVSALACAMPNAMLFETVGALHRLCALMNGFAFSGWFTAPPLAAMLIGFGLAVLPYRRPSIIGVALLIPTAAAIVTFLAHRSVDVPTAIFFDVGQGDAIALRSGKRTMLVDGGDHERILPLLADRGIVAVDVVALTHAHPDHCGGLVPVIEQLRVGELWVNPRRFRGDCATRLLDACMRTRTPVRLVRDRDVRTLGELRVTAHVLDRTFRRAPENNASLVLHVNGELLLTGDIEREAEIDLADRDLRSSILKVPHHGSRTSTSAMLLDAVQPRLAIISCGRHNLFGHPHPAVLHALRERRIRVRRTDRDGTIEVMMSHHVIDAAAARAVDSDPDAWPVRAPAELRRGALDADDPAGDARPGAQPQRPAHHRRRHPPPPQQRRERRAEKSLRRLPHRDPLRRNLLPRPSAHDPARRGREDAHDQAASLMLIVLAGPTGVGKSELGLRLAQTLGGEIVNYDSVQIYRGFDIGSAKPTLATRQLVPHHLYDIVDAEDEFNAADYARIARPLCERIATPILTGGTFFYLRALLAGLPEMPGRDEAVRARLRRIKPERLHRWLSKVDPVSSGRIAIGDRHRVERALEVWIASGRSISDWQRPEEEMPAVKIALTLERPRLHELLDARVDRMYRDGLFEETRALLERHDPAARPFGTIGYKEAAAVVRGELAPAAAIAETRRRTRAYAKRQMTWLRSERNVHWLDAADPESTMAAALRLARG